ncbi:immunity 22 family protein [Pedobacter sp. 22226]|uniref:immunity 22 family protein n=1 Tax=Pedobacter sp. 22226 TaxID=3453894 RepID=UPI003F85E3A9
MKKVHVWIGTTMADEENFYAYFNQDEDISQFSKDLGTGEEYDEDFIGILPLFKSQVPVVEVLVNQIPIAVRSIIYAAASCERYGIESVNAAFYLTDSTVNVPDAGPKSYNGLRYVGVFDSAL